MGFAYLTNVALQQAKQDYLKFMQDRGFAHKAEQIPVTQACGRVTTAAVYASICATHYAASAMDGVAVKAKDTFGATETTPVRLAPGQYIVLDTGDPVPENCDAVIMVEDIVKNTDESITIHSAAAPWQHIRQIGEDIKAMVQRAADECDMVLLNAGSSAGREDYSVSVIRELGEVLYHGIAMKPGKPAILGCCGSKPVLGVPGYPVSGIIVIEELLKPLVDAWLKADEQPRRFVRATLTRSIVSSLKYQEFVRVRLGRVGDKLTASPLSRGSGVVSSFMKADGILEVEQGVEGYEAGSEVSIRLLCPESKLDNTLVVIGSHDPLLDELGNMMHAADSSVYMNSAHVGSMGGIMAIRRGEAHAAGCHLLDTDTGVYNKSFLKKYFPNGGIRLIRCVGRQQGLMVQRGNPLGIQSFADIANPGLRYVNRQKGSGTRILTDYLCKKENVDAAKVYGYEREELTHTSVAAQIACGSADVGMGIYSVAKLYDLDFIPICIIKRGCILGKDVV